MKMHDHLQINSIRRAWAEFLDDNELVASKDECGDLLLSKVSDDGEAINQLAVWLPEDDDVECDEDDDDEEESQP